MAVPPSLRFINNDFRELLIECIRLHKVVWIVAHRAQAGRHRAPLLLTLDVRELMPKRLLHQLRLCDSKPVGKSSTFFDQVIGQFERYCGHPL
ncbi:hypothetical protein CKO42_01790 [Lamprobacter modestohalophilus]|uniref:Uncharacterized protein n=1 Tax=Lamprobacter modestohalophilus TaxID=1064514 RepID=A0A9X0W5E4_9GAMM|nr:hypothetical protein [Lamprobacter modestohalophilus]